MMRRVALAAGAGKRTVGFGRPWLLVLGIAIVCAVVVIVVLGRPAGAATSTFSNPTPITIPAAGTSGPASPYPSTINVSQQVGTVNDVNLTLRNFSHAFPDDVDILLVGPTGANAIVMSDVGGAIPANNITLTLDDQAANSLPDGGPLASGTFKPTNIGAGDTFPAPAPAPSGAVALSTFNGANPNGNWSLYVVDDISGDVGSIANGWSLEISTQPPAPCTIGGTDGDDVLVGTPGPDVICGFGGNDTIRGLGGNDRLIGGSGNDTLIGGSGNDRLIGGSGRDRMFGGSGRDRLNGRDGQPGDLLNGGPGDDSCAGDRGDILRSC